MTGHQIRRRRPLCAAALFTLSFALFGCVDPQQPTLADTPPQFGGEISVAPPLSLDWQAQARAQVAASRMAVLAAERVYVYLSVAQYAAIDAADRHGFADATLQDSDFGPGGRARFEAERGAVAGASAAVLGFFFPGQTALFEQLVDSEATARGATHPDFRVGLARGREVGQAIVARAQNDRFTVPFTGTIPTGPGFWIPAGTPIGATGAGVRPFLLSSSDQFRPPPPPAYGSAPFLTDLDEIRQLAATRTPEQLAIARAWAYPGGTFTPAGHWNQLASRYVAEHNLNERAAAHVFALMHAAQFDSHVIACADAKYTYWFIRPSQADNTITTPIGLPNHPSYPSGHSCASSAATTVLAHFFPDRATELSAQAAEAGMSRMYAGIHYRFDINAAVQLGRSIAQHAIALDRSSGLLSVLD